MNRKPLKNFGAGHRTRTRNLWIGRDVKSILSAALALGLASPAIAANMVFTSWGGTTQDAQKTAWAEKFTAATGIEVVQDGPTDYGKIKAMVEAKNVTWDVVDVESDYAQQACDAGLLEPLDFTAIEHKNLDARFVTPCSVGSFYFSFVLGFNPTAVKGEAPKSWANLFDVNKFPGKRAFYKWSAPGVIEAALLADGVQPDALYPLDLERAFKKLDTIKEHIVWWSGGAQSQQLLASAEAPYGMFWNGRLSVMQASGTKVGVSWEQNITAADSLVIPKGSKNKEAAMKFIAFASGQRSQAEFSAATGYAPINVTSAEVMDPAVLDTLPYKQTASQVNANLKYWALKRDEIGKRWYAWQGK